MLELSLVGYLLSSVVNSIAGVSDNIRSIFQISSSSSAIVIMLTPSILLGMFHQDKTWHLSGALVPCSRCIRGKHSRSPSSYKIRKSVQSFHFLSLFRIYQ